MNPSVADNVPRAPWPVFICYRQVDGSATARRLHQILDKWCTQDADGASVEFDVYFDQQMPGVADWQALHRPYLEKARALIVICTPGAKLNDGSGDWVHKEIEWWLAYRKAAPILIDPLMEGARYVPTEISARWPNIQRIPLREREWIGLPASELQAKTDEVRRLIVGAIVPSGVEIYAQELRAEKSRSTRLKYSLIVASLALTFSILAASLAYRNQALAHAATLKAEAASREAIRQQQMTEQQLFKTETTRVGCTLFWYTGRASKNGPTIVSDTTLESLISSLPEDKRLRFDTLFESALTQLAAAGFSLHDTARTQLRFLIFARMKPVTSPEATARARNDVDRLVLEAINDASKRGFHSVFPFFLNEAFISTWCAESL